MTIRSAVTVTFLLVAPLMLVGVAYLRSEPLRSAVPATAQAQVTEVPSPDHWVPFSATVRRLEPGKATDVVGKLYRGSDGSRRLESGPPKNRQAVISINNFTFQRTFGYGEAFGGWFEFPQRTSSIAPSSRIPKFRLDNQKYFEHAAVVAGLEVIRYTDPAGNVLLLAPSLNGEAVLTQRVDGTREELSDIVIGEQDPTLFELPPGTVLKPLPPNVLLPGLQQQQKPKD
jgi:hypothetical protein